MFHASKDEIEQTLIDMKRLIKSGHVTFQERCKNMVTPALLGMTVQDAYDEMLSLTKEHYRHTDIDRDYPDDDLFWFFKKNIFDNIIYIKFKIQYHSSGNTLITSFHLDKMQ